ncbi:MAG: tyrosine-type recombinase/integrase [Gallionella sp.]|nr:tyrosine-type recombinase/integrase [Gallionella sp.]
MNEPKKACQRVGQIAGLKFTPHDLRRTFATLFDELGVNSTTLEKALNHSPTTTASKHYIVQRLAHMRKLYQALEDKVLLEVGISDSSRQASIEDISPADLAASGCGNHESARL